MKLYIIKIHARNYSLKNTQLIVLANIFSVLRIQLISHLADLFSKSFVQNKKRMLHSKIRIKNNSAIKETRKFLFLVELLAIHIPCNVYKKQNVLLMGAQVFRISSLFAIMRIFLKCGRFLY